MRVLSVLHQTKKELRTRVVAVLSVPCSLKECIAADYFAIPIRRKPSERLRGPKQATAVPQAARPNSRPELLVSIRAPIPTDLVGAYTEAQRTISELEAKIEHLESVNANRRFMDHKLDETTRKNADYQRQIAYLTELRNREENIPSRASEAPAGYQYAGELRAAFTRNLDAIKGESEQAVKRCMTQVRLVEDENIKLRAELGKRLNLEADVRRYAMRHHREIVGHLRKRESLEQALEEKEIKISGLEARLERQRSEIRELIAEQG